MNDLLAEFPQAPLHVQVVWEPVLRTDVAPPLTGALALLSDRRVVQYWDPAVLLSADIVRDVNADPGRFGFDEPLPPDFVVWDVVAAFDGAAVWDRGFPAPAYYGGPVAGAIVETRAALARLLGR